MTLKSIPIILSAALAGLAALVPGALAQTPDAVVRAAVEDYIRPGYERLAEEAGTMTEAMASLCREPSEPHLAEARAGFADLVGAWSAIEFVRFGPVTDENRLERMLFWPDRRGIALRQVQAVLAEKDESAASAASLAEKSVAVQGLTALEFVLFGSNADELTEAGEAFRCRYGTAIADNIDTIASTLSAEWAREDGISGRLLSPSPNDPAYRSEADSLQEIVGIFIFGFEALRDLRLAPVLGSGQGEANPNAWIYRRSGLTKASLEANVDGLRQAFDMSGIAGLLPAEQRYITSSIAFEFDNAKRILGEIDAPLTEAVQNAEDYGRLTYLVILTQSLQALFADQLSPALGLSTGFSSLDGD